MEGIAQIDFSRKSFFMDFGVEFCRFLEALGAVFSGFLGLENRFENRGVFVMQTDPDKLNWGW